MKSLIRWGATLSLISSAVLGSWLSQNSAAWAIPAEAILQKLQPIPVFAIADDQGAPLVATGKNNEKVAGVFISQQDAQTFVQKLQQENPDLGKKVKVVPISLGEVYKLDEANANKPDGLDFAYVPQQTEVESAKQVLTANGQQYEGGVPLFVARGGEKQGYLVVQQNNQPVIPFFFEKEQLQQLIERVKKDKPDLASTVKIDVIPLESMIATMKQSDDEVLSKVVLVPSQESINFIRSNTAEPAPAQTPNQAPAPNKSK